jgi:hypothetical protein
MHEQSPASKRKFRNRDQEPGFVWNSEHLANVPNENCDQLSAQLQRAEERINQLERERDGFFDQLLAEAKAAIQDVQTNADARLKRTIREADERVTQLQAEAEIEIGHLHDELSEVTRDIDQLKADADERVECVKRETNDRVAMMENEAKKRMDVIQRENEDKVLRLEAELAQAKNRANRAEQWVMLIHNEIENRLMPSVTTMRLGPKSSNTAGSSGVLIGPTTSHSSVCTWFRRLWLHISATAALGNRTPDMERQHFRAASPV